MLVLAVILVVIISIGVAVIVTKVAPTRSYVQKIMYKHNYFELYNIINITFRKFSCMTNVRHN